MAPNELETKHAALVDELAKLNLKFKQFIEGSADVVIPVGTGGQLVKSVSGIVRDLNQFKYVQRVVDHRLYADMIAHTDLEVGMLVRVWGDTTSNNGLYKKDSGGFQKVSYQDLYDLRNFLPDPWNYYHFSFTEAELLANKKLLGFTLPVSTGTKDLLLQGTLKYRTNEPGYRGSYSTKFHLLITTGTQTEQFYIYQKFFSMMNALDAGVSETFPCYLKVIFNSDEMNHNGSVWFVPAMLPDGVTVLPGTLDLTFQEIDLNAVQVFTNSTEFDNTPEVPQAPLSDDLALLYNLLVA
jgi:hypothetical protein